MGIPLLKGGGTLVVAAGGRQIGPGHFGLLDLGDGVEKFSCHYEADMDRGGRSVLDIRPLLWKDGWPVAGDRFQGGTFEIQSERSGGALQLAVDFVRIPRGRRGFGGRQSGPVTPIPNQTLAEDSATWPSGTIDVDLGDYMVRPHQTWTITPVPDAGGYLGAPYFTITIAGTDRALAATADGGVVAVPAFTGGSEALWRIDQLTDGTYRIMPRSMPGSAEPVALTALGASTPVLIPFDPTSGTGRWTFRQP
jgi:arabinan endo-1,5-alpha-L-arabinosidase